MKQLLWAASSAAVLALATPSLAAEAVFTPQAIQAHVGFLADDLLEGRGTGARGHEIAARYVAAQLTALGLQPAGDNGGWYETVTLQERSLGPKGASLTVTGPAGAQSWANATEVIVAPSAREAELDLEAPVVFVGFGLDAPSRGFHDYRGLDVRGKIVAAFDGAPIGTPSEIGAHLAAEKAMMAQAHGAVGYIRLDTLSSQKRRPWSERAAAGRQPSMTWVDPSGVPETAAPKIRVSAILNSPAAEALFARAPHGLAGLMKIADKANGRPRGFALKTKVRIQASSVYRTLKSPAVVGLLRGADPAPDGEVVVLMAHLDHLGMRPENEGDKIYNGALDNAAGVAVMLEVAHAFATAPERPKRSVMFIANTAEEMGLLGADYFAHHPSIPISRIASVIDLDMPILQYDFTDVVAFGADHSTLGALVAQAAARMDVKVGPDPMPEQGVFVRSDHYPFVKQGVPALLLATGYANGGQAAWGDYLANRYHRPNDDLAQPINWAAGAKFARLNYLISREIADAPERPQWYAEDFFGDRFAPKASKAQPPR